RQRTRRHQPRFGARGFVGWRFGHSPARELNARETQKALQTVTSGCLAVVAGAQKPECTRQVPEDWTNPVTGMAAFSSSLGVRGKASARQV
ncbi:MAG TPA: hypothetical protein VJ908_06685, partial [Wenzhouxiangellaceae bacterium]|nr:hypothetical protein [Wenzhouxiangellaceae bacterium]